MTNVDILGSIGERPILEDEDLLRTVNYIFQNAYDCLYEEACLEEVEISIIELFDGDVPNSVEEWLESL